VSWWGSQAGEHSSNLPINRWTSSRLQIFNSSPAQNEVSVAPGLGETVLWEKVGLWFGYAGSAGGRWNGSWEDFHFSGSANDMHTADWGHRTCVTTVDFVWEYPSRVRDYVIEWHSWDDQWRTGVMSIAVTEFNTLPPYNDPEYSILEGSSVYISTWNNPGDDNAQSCRDILQCHRWDDTWNLFKTH